MIQQIQYDNGVSFQLCDYLPLQNEKTIFCYHNRFLSCDCISIHKRSKYSYKFNLATWKFCQKNINTKIWS